MTISDDMVSRFLMWPVPADVYPDGMPGKPGRTGTNLMTAPQARAMLEHVLSDHLGALGAEIKRLRTALRFYARGEHYHLDESEDFDTVSGEPQNWLCSGREDSATMIENGRVALFALQGIDANWRDGDEDNTPRPVEGEVTCAA